MRSCPDEHAWRWSANRLGSLLACVSLVATSVPAYAAAPAGAKDAEIEQDEGEADPILIEASEAAKAEDWDTASRILSDAYEQTGSPQYLYNMAQVERMRGNWQRAIDFYTIFINTDPPEEQKRAANQNIARCVVELNRQKAAEEELPPPKPDSEPERQVEPEPEPEPEPEQKPWHKDVLGGVLLGGGLTLAAVGGALVGVAHSRNAQAADDNDRHNDFQTQLDAAQGQNTAGLVLLGLGAAVAVGGAIRYGVVARKQRSDGEGVARVRVTPTLTGVALHGRF